METTTITLKELRKANAFMKNPFADGGPEYEGHLSVIKAAAEALESLALDSSLKVVPRFPDAGLIKQAGSIIRNTPDY